MKLKRNSGSNPPACSASFAHDDAWEKNFISPIAKAMKARGVAYLAISIRDAGKAAYVLEPTGLQAVVTERPFGPPINPITAHSISSQNDQREGPPDSGIPQHQKGN